MARPPRLPDAAILKLLQELRSQHAVVTGTLLRAELERRFGTRGGVSRIYRLLDQATAPRAAPAPSSPAPPAAPDPQSELAAALERARLAEHREEAHQARWAGEIHQLRERVRALNHAAHRLPVLEADLQDRSRELAAAYRRITDLEAQLR
jgi:DNA repair exonuclease SbcCD ATPase subunit